MRLKRLVIGAEYDDCVIRDVAFNSAGLSLIVDLDSKEGKSGNNIGKSTFVKIIDLCFGANNSGSLYHDTETKDDEKVKNFINNHKAYALLTVENDMGQIHLLKRELWDNGKCYVDGNKMNNISDFKSVEKNLIFPDAPRGLHFRDIISFFIRLEEFSDFLFQYHGKFQKSDVYKMVFQYILGMDVGYEEADENVNIKKLEEENRLILKRYHAKSVDDIQRQIDDKEKELRDLKEKINSFDVVTAFRNDKNNGLLVCEVDKEAQNIENLAESIRFFEEKVIEEKKTVEEIDKEALFALYGDGEQYINKLDKDFADLVEFHNGMVHTRIKRYFAKIDELKRELADAESRLKNARKRYSEEFYDFKYNVNLAGNEHFDEYADLLSKQNSLKQVLLQLNNNQENIEKAKAKMLKNGKYEIFPISIGKRLEEINMIFSEMTKRVMGCPYYIFMNETGFPIKCSDGKRSSGDKKAIYACFVFSVMSLFKKYNRDMPCFLIQDSMEGVSLATLKKLEIEADNVNCQYIIPILRDRAESLGDISQKEVLTLSHSEKLFKM